MFTPDDEEYPPDHETAPSVFMKRSTTSIVCAMVSGASATKGLVPRVKRDSHGRRRGFIFEFAYEVPTTLVADTRAVKSGVP